jgi:light-harvesting protein B-800-850 alpha chain
LVVKPTVGLPLFLGTVTLIALLVHGALVLKTDWFGAYWNGGKKAHAAVSAPADAMAPAAKQ